MTYILSIAPEEMTGSSKGVTAAKVRSRKYIRNKGIGGSVRTSTNPQRNPFSRSSPRAGNLSPMRRSSHGTRLLSLRLVNESSHLCQAHRFQPLHTSELLDCVLRWYCSCQPSDSRRCRGSCRRYSHS